MMFGAGTRLAEMPVLVRPPVTELIAYGAPHLALGGADDTPHEPMALR
jgi:hypothetical protein